MQFLAVVAIALALVGLHSSTEDATVDALTINATQVVASGDILGKHETRQKVWTISSLSHLQKLQIRVPGVVFVDYDASLAEEPDSDDSAPGSAAARSYVDEHVVAKIIVSGNSSDLIELLEVVPLDGDDGADGIKFHVKNQNTEARGYLLTQIYVSEQAVLRELSTVTEADTVLGENVLINDDSNAVLSLSSSGSGDIYLSSEKAIAVGTLEVEVSGSGDIQIEAPAVLVDDLSLLVFQSGDLVLLADTIAAEQAISTVAGSGDIVVQSENLTATDLNVNVAGSGTVTFSSSGTAVNQTIFVGGSGDVNTAAIVSENADVSILGSGSVVVQVTRELDTFVVASGSVTYVNARPEIINSRSWFRGKKHGHIVKQAHSNKAVKPYYAHKLPARQPELVHVRVSKSFFSEDPSVDAVAVADESTFPGFDVANLDVDPTTASITTTSSVTSNDATNTGLLIGFIAIAAVAVFAAVRKYTRRKMYTPLA